MRQPFFQKTGVWQGLGLLIAVGIFVLGVILPRFVAINSLLFDLVWTAVIGLIGLYHLFLGMKKFRQRKARQPQVGWYTQPSILVGIGMFFLVFISLVLQVLGLSTLDLTVWVLVLLPTWICWLVALVFLVRNWRTLKGYGD